MSEMKYWRPSEGWDPHEIRQRVLMLCGEEEPNADCQIKLVEAGANAILELAMMGAQRIEPDKVQYAVSYSTLPKAADMYIEWMTTAFFPQRTGWLIFIEDKDE